MATSNEKQQLEQAFIQQFIPFKQPKNTQGFGQAPVNIALSKYWGKRQTALNLPTNSSLSISLPGLGTKTSIQLSNQPQDQAWLNGELLAPTDVFAARLTSFLNYFRPANQAFEIRTENNVPTAAGLASSASGYAALVLALDDLFGWNLSLRDLSILARIGSGSASRSVYPGFAIWHQGQKPDGSDSFAEALDTKWPEFNLGLVKVNIQQKPISSTAGMQQTVETCELYQAWPAQAERQVKIIQQAILEKNFSLLGATAEHNALSMHATMIATWPPIVYWQPASIEAMQRVWKLRQQGVEVYFTMDAGPNLKLMFLNQDSAKIQQEFADLQIIAPFASN